MKRVVAPNRTISSHVSSAVIWPQTKAGKAKSLERGGPGSGFGLDENQSMVQGGLRVRPPAARCAFKKVGPGCAFRGAPLNLEGVFSGSVAKWPFEILRANFINPNSKRSTRGPRPLERLTCFKRSFACGSSRESEKEVAGGRQNRE